MPVAIVMPVSEVTPAILAQESDALLLAALSGLKDAPNLATVLEAQQWLATLPQPSGWYDSPEAALAEAKRLRQSERLTGEFVSKARASLNMSRADFAEAIGYRGNSNTRHKTMFEVENGVKSLSPEASLALRGLLAEHGLESQ
ncbi:hypothetical protein [Pacificoceanicola onchidii]|uniref:hypothetical protein n=1 Tax=Pacificoceanicola onchidii TaxID=2562685 RepID=UPI0010A65A96|nr:hypothetical protein [Pacificoceanicola onchidii]